MDKRRLKTRFLEQKYCSNLVLVCFEKIVHLFCVKRLCGRKNAEKILDGTSACVRHVRRRLFAGLGCVLAKN